MAGSIIIPLSIAAFGFSLIAGVSGCGGYLLFLYYSLRNQGSGEEKKEDKDLESKINFSFKVLLFFNHWLISTK